MTELLIISFALPSITYVSIQWKKQSVVVFTTSHAGEMTSSVHVTLLSSTEHSGFSTSGEKISPGFEV